MDTEQTSVQSQESPERQIAALLSGNADTNQAAFEGRDDVTTTEPKPEPDKLETDEPGNTGDTDKPGLEAESTDNSNEREPGQDESDEPEPDEDKTGQDADEPEPAFDLSAMAEKMGLEVSDLYEMEIPLGGGRDPVTLGQFKDYVQDLFTVEERQTSLEAQKMAHENTVIRDQQELVAMINESGVALTPELQQRAAEASQVHAQQQRALLLTSIPGWVDREQYQADRAQMVETLTAHYPITEAQIGAQQEAVTIKMMYDLTRLTRLVNESNLGAKRIPKVPRRPGRKPRVASKKANEQKQIIQQGADSSDPATKARAVSQLLGAKR